MDDTALHIAPVFSELTLPQPSTQVAAHTPALHRAHNQPRPHPVDDSIIHTPAQPTDMILAALHSFRHTLQPLTDTSQTGGIVAASNKSFVEAVVGSHATSGTYNVHVAQLAQAQINTAAAAATMGSAANLGDGIMLIQVGRASASAVQIGNSMSLTELARSINLADSGVTATVVQSAGGFLLLLTGTQTGEENNVTYTQLGLNLGLNDPPKQQAQDLQVDINGVKYRNKDNILNGAIGGVTLRFSDTGDATVALVANGQKTAKSMHEFVDGYNRTLSILQAQGPALGTVDQANMGKLVQSMGDMLGRPSQGTRGIYQSLTDIGVQSSTSGALTLSDARLAHAVAVDADSVAALLSGSGSAGIGLAQSLSGMMQAGLGQLAHWNEPHKGLPSGKI